MAKGVTIKVDGLKDLDRALGELGKSAGKAVLRRVLKAAAEPIYQAAKARAPSRPAGAKPVYYGKGENKRLRRPGTDEALVQSGTRLTRNQQRTVKREGKDTAEHYVGSRDPIARLLEYGTVNTRAQPVFRPAWEANKDQALTIIKESLGAQIEKTAKRQQAKAARLAAKG